MDRSHAQSAKKKYGVQYNHQYMLQFLIPDKQTPIDQRGKKGARMREVTVAYKRIGAPTAGCREALRRSTLLVTSDLGYQELITRKRRIDSGFPSFSYFFAFPPPPLGIGSVDLCHLLSRFKERNTKEEKRSLPSRKRRHRLLREFE